MADLEVTLTGQEVRLGDAANARIALSIRNTTAAALRRLLWINIPKALVSDSAKAGLTFTGLRASEVPTTTDGTTRWQLGPALGVSFAAGEAVSLTLTEIAAGQAGTHAIRLDWSATRNDPGDGQSINISVLAASDVPRIDSFAVTPVLLTRVPGQASPAVTFNWSVETGDDPNAAVRLYSLGKPVLPPPGDAGTAPPVQPGWQYVLPAGTPTGLQPFELRVSAGGRSVSRLAFVWLQDPGWNRVSCGREAPSLLLADSDTALYGVFRLDGVGRIRKLDPQQGLFGDDAPLCCEVPPGLETSPGLFWNRRIWLIGGSQIDPARPSNTVWSYDPLARKAETGTAQWIPRMGHACVLFQDMVWVLGGSDENGNALDDIWCSADGEAWSLAGRLPAKLTLLTAVSWRQRLWIYAGANFAGANFVLLTPNRLLWSHADGGPATKSQPGGGWQPEQWTQLRLQMPAPQPDAPDLQVEPFAAALYVRAGGLHVLTTARDPHGSFTSANYTLLTQGGAQGGAHAQIARQEAIAPNAAWSISSRPDAEIHPFRLDAVAFRNFLFVLSLVDGVDDRSLVYHITGS